MIIRFGLVTIIFQNYKVVHRMYNKIILRRRCVSQKTPKMYCPRSCLFIRLTFNEHEDMNTSTLLKI